MQSIEHRVIVTATFNTAEDQEAAAQALSNGLAGLLQGTSPKRADITKDSYTTGEPETEQVL